MLTVRLTKERLEVIPVEHHIDTPFFSFECGVANPAKGRMLRLDLDTDSDLVGHRVP